MLLPDPRLPERRTARRAAVVDLGGVEIRLGKHIAPEIRRQLETGTYEWPELAILRRKLLPTDVVLELGTGLGFLATYCARVVGSERVFTYEGNPRLKRHILDTFARNGVAPRLEMCLLTERTGKQTFYVEDAFWASSTLRGGAAKAVTVPSRRFDDELARIKPTFLIIDIEGGEYDLCRQTQFAGVRKLLIEIHKERLGPRKTRHVKARLHRAGFRILERFPGRGVYFLRRW